MGFARNLDGFADISAWLLPIFAMPCALCLSDSLCAEPAPTKGFSCSSCAFTCRLCVDCLNKKWCPKCLRGKIPLGDAHSDDEDDDELKSQRKRSKSGSTSTISGDSSDGQSSQQE
eukprot:symbB.v1.2.023469.t1/scaffold2148.1/size153101/7